MSYLARLPALLAARNSISHETDTDSSSNSHTTNPGPDNHDTENSSNSHTTNPRALSCSHVPLTSEGVPITSLRNRYHFPSARNLPHDDDIDKNYFALNTITMSFRPMKHWAYLGEIISMGKFTRLNLQTRDLDGNQVPIWFYLDHTGNGYPESDAGLFRTFTPDPRVALTGTAVEDGVTMKVGYTFVMVYPELRNFLDGTTGIRVDGDEKGAFKVLPYSLNELLAANDTIVAQKLPNFTPLCQTCKTEIIDLKKSLCGRCCVAYYCSKECQEADWKPSNADSDGKKHKTLCKIYKEVKWFTDLDWDKYAFREGIRFQR